MPDRSIVIGQIEAAAHHLFYAMETGSSMLRRDYRSQASAALRRAAALDPERRAALIALCHKASPERGALFGNNTEKLHDELRALVDTTREEDER